MYFALHDPDPEMLLRIGNLYYQAAAEIAADRKRSGRQTTIIQSARLDFGETA